MIDPERAIIQVQSSLPATVMLAQTTLRAVLGQHMSSSAANGAVQDRPRPSAGFKMTYPEARRERRHKLLSIPKGGKV
jgi:hypothetical protein